jgi:hypothetical protein
VIQVKATREGLVGQKTASGYVIDVHVPFVALPSTKALHRFVDVYRFSENGGLIASCRAVVLDVGPHYTDDFNYVDLGDRPRAESQPGGNGAGIDLGEYVWKALGMTDNGPVSWEFVQ